MKEGNERQQTSRQGFGQLALWPADEVRDTDVKGLVASENF